jgi:hypothetical protein
MRLSAGSAAILAFGAASPGPQFSNMLTTFALSGLVGVQVSTVLQLQCVITYCYSCV